MRLISKIKNVVGSKWVKSLRNEWVLICYALMGVFYILGFLYFDWIYNLTRQYSIKPSMFQNDLRHQNNKNMQLFDEPIVTTESKISSSKSSTITSTTTRTTNTTTPAKSSTTTRITTTTKSLNSTISKAQTSTTLSKLTTNKKTTTIAIIKTTPKEDEYKGWGRNISRDMRLYLNPDEKIPLLNPKGVCNETFELLMVVCTAVQNFDQRKFIRNTWARDALSQNFTIKIVFLIGLAQTEKLQKKVQAEYDKKNDIIQERFVDSYNNLTIKTSMLLKWVSNHCQNQTKFVMKLDDDNYVNVHNLVQLLDKRNVTKDFILGCPINGKEPYRDSDSKWYVPKYLYPAKIYPNYIAGSSYLMSVNAAVKLYKVVLETPFLPMEDIYISGVCAKKTDIELIAHWGFNMDTFMSACDYKDSVSSVSFIGETMMKMYKFLQQKNIYKKCPKSK